MNRKYVPIVFFFCIAAASNCATFITGDTETVDLTEYESSNLPLKFSFDQRKAALSFGDKSELRNNLRRSFRDSRLFLAVESDPGGKPTAADPLYFRVKLENRKGPIAYTVGFCSGFLSGLTLLLFPAYERTPYHWYVDVYRQGVKVGEFQYDSASHYVAQWLVFPFMFASPLDWDRSRIVEEFVQTFLRDARAKGLF